MVRTVGLSATTFTVNFDINTTYTYADNVYFTFESTMTTETSVGEGPISLTFDESGDVPVIGFAAEITDDLTWSINSENEMGSNLTVGNQNYSYGKGVDNVYMEAGTSYGSKSIIYKNELTIKPAAAKMAQTIVLSVALLESGGPWWVPEYIESLWPVLIAP